MKKIYLKIISLTCFLLNVAIPLFSQIINVRQYGARGNGTTDDTRAIQAAINAASISNGATVYFPSGIYLIGSYFKKANYLENFCLNISSGITFKGEGSSSVIKLNNHLFDKTDTMANAHIFFGIGIKDVQFMKITIDMNGGMNLVPKNILKNNMALFIDGGRNIYINDITIKNCSGSNMIAIKGRGSNLQIKNSFFYNGGNYVGIPEPNTNQIDFSFIYSEWDSTSIINNHIEQENVDIALENYTGGIELHGSFSLAKGNTIIGCNPGLYISSSWYPVTKTSITGNKFYQCVKGISFWIHYPLDQISISKNIITITESLSNKFYNITGIEVPNGNALEYNFKLANAAKITRLSIKNNTISSLLKDSSKIKSAGMVLHSIESSIIENNTIKAMNYGGIVFQGSKWGMKSVFVNNNNFIDFKINNDKNAVAGYIIITDTYSTSFKNTVGFKDIIFIKNNFIRALDFRKQKNPNEFLGAFIALPSSSLSEVHFQKNHFSDITEKIKFIKTDN
ncbi:MAG: glycosyl hydrolase family 28-related protein [Ferruginibacter sp.]